MNEGFDLSAINLKISLHKCAWKWASSSEKQTIYKRSKMFILKYYLIAQKISSFCSITTTQTVLGLISRKSLNAKPEILDENEKGA